jgi:exonuclease VII large subunit
MENVQQPENDKKSMQFNIGKSYGLSNQEQKLHDYQKKLENISTELSNRAKQQFEELDKSIAEIKERMAEMHSEVLERQQEVIDKQAKMIDQISSHYSANYDNNPKAKELMDEVLKLGMENFKRNLQVSVINEKELSVKVNGFGEKAVLLLTQAGKEYIEFIKVLKAKDADFTGFEEGYHHGDALRIALAENTDRSEK